MHLLIEWYFRLEGPGEQKICVSSLSLRSFWADAVAQETWYELQFKWNMSEMTKALRSTDTVYVLCVQL